MYPPSHNLQKCPNCSQRNLAYLVDKLKLEMISVIVWPAEAMKMLCGHQNCIPVLINV